MKYNSSLNRINLNNTQSTNASLSFPKKVHQIRTNLLIFASEDCRSRLHHPIQVRINNLTQREWEKKYNNITINLGETIYLNSGKKQLKGISTQIRKKESCSFVLKEQTQKNLRNLMKKTIISERKLKDQSSKKERKNEKMKPFLKNSETGFAYLNSLANLLKKSMKLNYGDYDLNFDHFIFRNKIKEEKETNTTNNSTDFNINNNDLRRSKKKWNTEKLFSNNSLIKVEKSCQHNRSTSLKNELEAEELISKLNLKGNLIVSKLQSIEMNNRSDDEENGSECESESESDITKKSPISNHFQFNMIRVSKPESTVPMTFDEYINQTPKKQSDETPGLPYDSSPNITLSPATPGSNNSKKLFFEQPLKSKFSNMKNLLLYSPAFSPS